ncbi:MAG: toxin-antitoxin system TumE family protein [Ardenticatenaceae bacterium]
MNPIIRTHFDSVKARLTLSRAIISYRILRREVATSDGKLRIKAALRDGGVAEFFEYVAQSGEQITLLKYSFDWRDVSGKLRQRWDNAPHDLDLPHAPHHVHEANHTVRGVSNVPDLLSVIDEIEKALIS